MKGGYSQLTIEAHIVRKRGFMSFTWLLVGSSGLENLNVKLHNNNNNRGCSDSSHACKSKCKLCYHIIRFI